MRSEPSLIEFEIAYQSCAESDRIRFADQGKTFELAVVIRMMRIMGRPEDHGLRSQKNQGFWGKENKQHDNRAVFRREPSRLRVHEHSGFADKNYQTRARPRTVTPNRRAESSTV
jgi:hypothetical protein